MQRFFVTATIRTGRDVLITGDQAHQIARVLKLHAGEEIVLVPVGQTGDAAGEWRVRLDAVEPRAVHGVITAARATLPEPRCAVTLCVAPLKGERFDWLVQKATELGVTVIQPVLTARTVRRVRGEESGALARWRRIATEAAEQSGRGIVPKVQTPVPLLAVAASGRALIAHEGIEGNAALTPLTALGPDATAAILFIGPEGGFAADEVAVVQAHYGATVVSLGPRVLRAETAAITAVTLALAATGDLAPPAPRTWTALDDG